MYAYEGLLRMVMVLEYFKVVLETVYIYMKTHMVVKCFLGRGRIARIEEQKQSTHIIIVQVASRLDRN